MWKLVRRGKLSNHKSNSITPLVNTLHWPPFAIRIKSKVFIMPCKALAKLSDLISLLPPSPPLHFPVSTSLFFFRTLEPKLLACFPRVCQTIAHNRSFISNVPLAWNILPPDPCPTWEQEYMCFAHTTHA